MKSRILEEAKELRKIWGANEGRIVVQEFYINKERTYPPQSALFSVNMLVNTRGGRCYSPEEIKSWFEKTGLKNIEKKLIDDSVLMIGKTSEAE